MVDVTFRLHVPMRDVKSVIGRDRTEGDSGKGGTRNERAPQGQNRSKKTSGKKANTVACEGWVGGWDYLSYYYNALTGNDLVYAGAAVEHYRIFFL